MFVNTTTTIDWLSPAVLTIPIPDNQFINNFQNCSADFSSLPSCPSPLYDASFEQIDCCILQNHGCNVFVVTFTLQNNGTIHYGWNISNVIGELSSFFQNYNISSLDLVGSDNLSTQTVLYAMLTLVSCENFNHTYFPMNTFMASTNMTILSINISSNIYSTLYSMPPQPVVWFYYYHLFVWFILF